MFKGNYQIRPRQLRHFVTNNEVFIFAVKILFLVALTLLVTAGLVLLLPRNPTSYFHGFRLKDERLKASSSPKIVLVGGSNVAFGMDSHVLSHEFGVNVVNTGLSAGLGLGFYLNSVEKYIHAGDSVVLSLEYEHYFQMTGGDLTLCELLFEEPHALRYLGWEHCRTLIEGFGRVCGWRLTKSGGFTPDRIYNAKAFNEYGDVVSHLDKRPENTDPVSVSWGSAASVSSTVLERLAQFISHAEKRGARIYILPPSYRDQDYTVNTQNIENIYQTLRTAFPKETLSKPQDFVLNGNEYFFETKYHLNKRGREIRTAKVVEFIFTARQKADGR